MEYGEAWLLEVLALNRLPVHCMTRSEVAMKEWLNFGYHGLSPEGLVTTLTTMFQRGDIDAYYDDELIHPATLHEFSLALSSKESTMHCGVTQQGGNRWEILAMPNWNRYFEDSGWSLEYVEITTATRERLIELVSNAELLWRCKMELRHELINSFAPWEPLAWKRLQCGYRARVRYERIDDFFLPREELLRENRLRIPRISELRTWKKSICGFAY